MQTLPLSYTHTQGSCPLAGYAHRQGSAAAGLQVFAWWKVFKDLKFSLNWSNFPSSRNHSAGFFFSLTTEQQTLLCAVTFSRGAFYHENFIKT